MANFPHSVKILSAVALLNIVFCLAERQNKLEAASQTTEFTLARGVSAAPKKTATQVLQWAESKQLQARRRLQELQASAADISRRITRRQKLAAGGVAIAAAIMAFGVAAKLSKRKIALQQAQAAARDELESAEAAGRIEVTQGEHDARALFSALAEEAAARTAVVAAEQAARRSLISELVWPRRERARSQSFSGIGSLRAVSPAATEIPDGGESTATPARAVAGPATAGVRQSRSSSAVTLGTSSRGNPGGQTVIARGRFGSTIMASQPGFVSPLRRAARRRSDAAAAASRRGSDASTGSRTAAATSPVAPTAVADSLASSPVGRSGGEASGTASATTNPPPTPVGSPAIPAAGNPAPVAPPSPAAAVAIPKDASPLPRDRAADSGVTFAAFREFCSGAGTRGPSVLGELSPSPEPDPGLLQKARGVFLKLGHGPEAAFPAGYRLVAPVIKISTYATEIQAFLDQLARDGVKDQDEVKKRVEALPANVARAVCLLAARRDPYSTDGKTLYPINDPAILNGIALALGVSKDKLLSTGLFSFFNSKDSLKTEIQKAYAAQKLQLEKARRQQEQAEGLTPAAAVS